jgi:plasmid stabilization system protein ParE
VALTAYDVMSEKFVFALAEQDIEVILRWTQQHFGRRGRMRYEALLVRAIIDITDKPALPGSQRDRRSAMGCGLTNR